MLPIYKRAIELNPFTHDDIVDWAAKKLVGHLIVFYWRGTIEFEGKHSELLIAFWENTPDALKAYAFEFFGRCLMNWKENFEPVFESKLFAYIDIQLDFSRKKQTSDSFKKELSAYGWCFSSAKLDKGKRINYLLNILRITKSIDHDYDVVSKLNKDFVDEYSDEVLECLEIMIKGLDRTMELYAWKSDLKEMFQTLLSEDEKIVQRTSKLLQFICQKDYHLLQEFKSL